MLVVNSGDVKHQSAFKTHLKDGRVILNKNIRVAVTKCPKCGALDYVDDRCEFVRVHGYCFICLGYSGIAFMTRRVTVFDPDWMSFSHPLSDGSMTAVINVYKYLTLYPDTVTEGHPVLYWWKKHNTSKP